MITLPDDLLHLIINKYGMEEQIRQTMGECGELIAVLQNYYRAQKFGYRTETITDVMEEAVDVFFMIQQIRSINPELFDTLCFVKQKKVVKKLELEY
jgi:hypothetical protein